MPSETDMTPLLPVLLIFSLLLFCAIGWCILSSCMGKPILDLLRESWSPSGSSVGVGRDGYRPYRRVAPGLRDGEMWEMEYRSRVG
ncbi:hypothetical protein OE88DRAFT_29243 [Heliocybe sulcata]|uniref:Uncharacterized protein n=1 Tax=Heliocybe sulcata TaxID=5364 RepID=A0A5C3NS41_9AGAM|nr:hypothetical protein OE88DRAFT_29243 [Heliocybe sulcata]